MIFSIYVRGSITFWRAALVGCRKVPKSPKLLTGFVCGAVLGPLVVATSSASSVGRCSEFFCVAVLTLELEQER